MEKCDRNEPEETEQEGLLTQDSAVCQVQDVDLDGLQSDEQSQKSGYAAQSEASEHGITNETQKMKQREKEVPAETAPRQDSLQKSPGTESPQQECKKLVEDEEQLKKTDENVMVIQKVESSFVLEQDSNQPEADAILKEHDGFAKDKLLESGGNTTVQRKAGTPESILFVSDQESNQITENELNAINQECDESAESESLQPKLETEQLKEESLLAKIKDKTQQAAEQDANDVAQQECDRTRENDGDFQKSESHPLSLQTRQLEQVAPLPLPSKILQHRQHTMKRPSLPPLLEDSTETAEQDTNDVAQECYRTRETGHFQESESGPASLAIPNRTRRHRQHAMQPPSLPPLLEEPEPPLEPFEVEIPFGRNRRMLGIRLPTVPTGIRDYLIRLRERHIPPESHALFEEMHTRCVKLFCSLLIGGVLAVALYFLIDFLERNYGNHWRRL